MIELIDIFAILFYTFLALVFFIMTISELKRGETLLKSSFMTGCCFVILMFLSVIEACGIIDKDLFLILIVIGFIIYLLITAYAFKYVKSTIVYDWEQKVE